MNEDAVVTVILPFRNAGHYLAETLASLEAQTFEQWHLVIVDDGSSDESVGAARRFVDRHPGKVTLVPGKGVGAADSRNAATALVQTRYVAFLDADDVWLPNKLEVQLSAMQASGAAFSYTAFKKIDADSQVGQTIFPAAKGLSYKRLLANNPVRCFTVVYDRYKLGPVFMPSIKMRNDLLAWLSVFKRIDAARGTSEMAEGAIEPLGPTPVLPVDQVLGHYRQYGHSLTGNKFRAAKYQWIAYRKYLRLSLAASLRYFLEYALRGAFSYAIR